MRCLLALVLPLFVLVSSPAEGAVLRPGDVLVLGTSDVGSGVIRVDPASGAQTLVSPGSIRDFTVDPERRLFAIVEDTVVEIDPETGGQSEVIPTGSLLRPVAIAVGPDGGLFVLDQDALGGLGALFRFDPVTKTRSTVSDGGILARGIDMEISRGGDPVVIWKCCVPGFANENPPIRIDASTGEQAPVLGGVYFQLTGLGLGLDAGGGEIVSNGIGNATFIYRISVESGEVTVVGSTAAEDPDNPPFGFRELLGTDAAIDQSGRLLLTAGGASTFPRPSLPAGLYDATLYDPISVGSFTELQVVPGILATIDIRPYDRRNRISLTSHLPVPIAILGSEDFDVKKIDVTTLEFGPSAATPAYDLRNRWIYRLSLFDVNRDGHLDLVRSFQVQKTGLALGDAEGCLFGELGGEPFGACDEVDVRMYGCGLGFELAFVLPPLMWLRRRRSRPAAASLREVERETPSPM